MELLIPGLALVALMVYASTRIKKSAAKAYESETIETDDFVIIKPAGFLAVVGGDPAYAFEAYTKDFGSDETSDIRKATVHVVIDRSPESSATVDENENVMRDETEQIGGSQYRITESRRKLRDIDLRVLRKAGQKDGRPVVLEVVFLNETTDEFIRDIESMLQSFELK
jgi:archaellum component FlaG (FlaF/FlaG flagellin family)